MKKEDAAQGWITREASCMSRRAQEMESEQEHEQAPGRKPRHDGHAFQPEAGERNYHRVLA